MKNGTPTIESLDKKLDVIMQRLEYIPTDQQGQTIVLRKLLMEQFGKITNYLKKILAILDKQDNR